MFAPFRTIDLGQISYADAYREQLRHHREILALRETAPQAESGRILLVEHAPPVITISRRPDARRHLTATPEQLAAAGVQVAETDRGGDITYHGPGQLVIYPIVDLNRLNLRLHAYLRSLEQAVINLCRSYDLDADREKDATGVWIRSPQLPQQSAKVCAMGVRVQRWVTLHGLALNVSTNLDHFDLIVPCGLAGRSVTSLARELPPDRTPSMEQVKVATAQHIAEQLSASVIEHPR